MSSAGAADPDALGAYLTFRDLAERGDSVTLEEYCGRFPGLASQIRELHEDWRTIEGFLDRDEGSSSPQAASRDRARTEPPFQIPGYRVLRCLGSGAMGVVYEGEREATGERVAIKILNASAAGSPHMLRRFEREVQTLRDLDHPSVVRVLDAGEKASFPYVVMELIEGAPLDTGTDPPTRLEDTRGLLGLIVQVARALQYLHDRGVVHRDVKPRNIVLQQDGTPVLVDFGLVYDKEQTSLTATGVPVGTPGYIAPEIMAGGKPDQRVDVFGLGATLYRLLTGKTPPPVGPTTRNSEPPSAWKYGGPVPMSLARVVAAAMRHDPRERYATCGDLADDLEAFLDGRRPNPPGAGWIPTLRRWRARHPMLAAGLSLTLLSAVGLATAEGVHAANWRARRELDQRITLSAARLINGGGDAVREEIRDLVQAHPEDIDIRVLEAMSWISPSKSIWELSGEPVRIASLESSLRFFPPELSVEPAATFLFEVLQAVQTPTAVPRYMVLENGAGGLDRLSGPQAGRLACVTALFPFLREEHEGLQLRARLLEPMHPLASAPAGSISPVVHSIKRYPIPQLYLELERPIRVDVPRQLSVLRRTEESIDVASHDATRLEMIGSNWLSSEGELLPRLQGHWLMEVAHSETKMRGGSESTTNHYAWLDLRVLGVDEPVMDLHGVVRGPGGRPVSGALVACDDLGRGVRTEPDGSFLLPSVSTSVEEIRLLALHESGGTPLVGFVEVPPRPAEGSWKVDLRLQVHRIGDLVPAVGGDSLLRLADSQGAIVETLPLPYPFRHVAMDHRGLLWMAGGNYLTCVSTAIPARIVYQRRFENGSFAGIAHAPDASLWVHLKDRLRLLQFDLEDGAKSCWAIDLLDPSDMTFDSDQPVLWYTVRASSPATGILGRIDLASAEVTDIMFSGAQANAVALDSSGRAWVALDVGGSESVDRIEVFAPTAELLISTDVGEPGLLMDDIMVFEEFVYATATDGHFSSNYNPARLFRFSLDGALARILVIPREPRTWSHFALMGSGHGALYLNDASKDTVLRLDPMSWTLQPAFLVKLPYNGGDPTGYLLCQQRPMADFDGDGLTNGDELERGTNPFVAGR